MKQWLTLCDVLASSGELTQSFTTDFLSLRRGKDGVDNLACTHPFAVDSNVSLRGGNCQKFNVGTLMRRLTRTQEELESLAISIVRLMIFTDPGNKWPRT